MQFFLYLALIFDFMFQVSSQTYNLVFSKIDDGSFGPYNLATKVTFNNVLYSSMYINSNGLISFLSAESSPSPSKFPISLKPLIAPFWTDIDTRVAGDILFKDSTYTPANVDSLISSVLNKTQLNDLFTLNNMIKVYNVTWDQVAAYSGSKQTTNTFQLFLITNGNLTYLLLNYIKVTWPSSNYNVRIGYNGGDSTYFLMLDNAFVSNLAASLTSNTNCNNKGKWLFRIDNSKYIIQTTSTSTTKPTTTTSTSTTTTNIISPTIKNVLKNDNINEPSIILNGHLKQINNLVYLESKKLASLSLDGKINIWNYKNNTILYSFNNSGPYYNDINLSNRTTFLLSFKPLALIISTNTNDNKIKLWNYLNGTLMYTLSEHTDSINNLIILNDTSNISNSKLVSSSFDYTIKIWSLSTGSLFLTLNELKNNAAYAHSLLLLSNSKLATSLNNGSIIIWDISNNNYLTTRVLYILNDRNVNSQLTLGLISNDLLVSGSSNGILSLWNYKSGNLIKSKSLINEETQSIYSISNMLVLSNNLIALSSKQSKMLKIFDIEKYELKFNLNNNESYVNTIMLTSSSVRNLNDIVLSLTNNNKVKLWYFINGTLLFSYNLNENYVMTSLLPLRNNRIICGLSNGGILVFNQPKISTTVDKTSVSYSKIMKIKIPSNEFNGRYYLDEYYYKYGLNYIENIIRIYYLFISPLKAFNVDLSWGLSIDQYLYLDAKINYLEETLNNYRRSRINENADLSNFLFQSSQGKFNTIRTKPKLIFPNINSIIKSTPILVKVNVTIPIYFEDDLVSSSIISFSQAYQLKSLCNFSSDLNFKLLYQGDRDGFQNDIYRAKINTEENLFTLIKTSRGNVFGGFTSKKFIFEQKNGYIFQLSFSFQYDENAFLFSLLNTQNSSYRLNIIDPAHASRNQYLEDGPSFGYDLFTSFDSSNNFMYGYSLSTFLDGFSLVNILRQTFEPPLKTFLTNEQTTTSKYGLTYYYFFVSNIEIYKVDFCFKPRCQNGGTCVSNKTFAGCICKENTHGSLCQFKQLNSTIFSNSTILNQELSIQLCNLINLPLNSSYSLVYQASRNGFKSSDFHTKADNLTSTLTVIKTDKGYVLGGYTAQNWTYKDEKYKDDDYAFLFSLTNLYNKSVQMKIVDSIAICFCKYCGPSFGGVFIGEGENEASGSIDSLYSKYEIPNFISNPDLMGPFLVGANRFLVSEIEIYQLDQCSLSPCKNGGRCVLIFQGFKCICKNDAYGITCQYKIFDSKIFSNSTILTQELSIRLLNVTGLPVNKNYTLKYQASRDNFSAFSFRQKTDGVVNSLLVIRTLTDSFCLFFDENAFMYSLVNNINTAFKMNIIDPTNPIAISIGSNLPCFNLDSYKQPDYIKSIGYLSCKYDELELYSIDPILISPCKNGGSYVSMLNGSYRCECANKFTGLFCTSRVQNSTIFTNSIILSQEMSVDLLNLLNISLLNLKFKMVYQATKNELISGVFFDKLYNIANILLVIKTNNHIIGAYYQYDIMLEEARIHSSSVYFGLDEKLKYSLNSYLYNEIKSLISNNFYDKSIYIEEIEAYTIEDKCWNSPCLNGGACKSNSTKYVCLCAEKFQGTHCEYSKQNSSIFNNSTFLTQELSVKLLNLTNLKRNFTLKYQASRDGFYAKDFHLRCDNLNGTLVVIQNLDGSIFGGYTEANWNGSGYKYDKKAFIFFLDMTIFDQRTNKFISNIKLEVIKPEYAIYSADNYGPYFGGIIKIYDKSNLVKSNVNSYSYEYFPSGSFVFDLYSEMNEIEVYS